MTQTTNSNVSPSKGVVIYFEHEILKWAAPVTVLDKFAMTKPMPKNKGLKIEFRRPNTFTAATVPLTEGVTPSGTAFTYTVVDAQLAQYGQVVEITDVIEDTNVDPVLNDAAVQCGENVGRTIEALTYGVVKAGTQVIYINAANTATSRAQVNSPITLGKVRSAVRTLQQQKAMMITRMLDSSTNYGTKGIEASFVAVGHTDMANDIRQLPGFTPVAEYGSRQPIHERELGSTEDVRFILSPDLPSFPDSGAGFASSGTNMVTTSGVSCDVYPLLVFGKQAYGCVPLKGLGAVEPTIIPVGQKTKDDPLGQRGYVGWKTWFTAKILNDAWMVRVECAVTAL